MPEGLPVAGYTSQSDDNVKIVNFNKEFEEQLLRNLDSMSQMSFDPKWIEAARTHFEQGFMCMNRAVFQPQRVKIKTGFEIKPD